MRIARYRPNASSSGSDPRYGIVDGDAGDEIVSEVEGDPLYRPVQFTGQRAPLSDVRLLAPVIPRSKVIGIGRNYAEHAAEMNSEPPTDPLVFLKPNTAVIGPDDAIAYPPQSSEVHFEGELAVVVGRLCRDVPRDRVDEVIFGYTCGNDVTARDLQRSDGQWSRAKGFDTFCPLGPWIETDLDPGDLGVITVVNDEIRQDARTSDMLHDVAALISYVSAAMTLLPGDVILTGTPSGVGALEIGDEVSVSVEGIGTLTNRVATRG